MAPPAGPEEDTAAGAAQHSLQGDGDGPDSAWPRGAGSAGLGGVLSLLPLLIVCVPPLPSLPRRTVQSSWWLMVWAD